MAEKSNKLSELSREAVEKLSQRLQRAKALTALERLREIGENLPVVDAAAIVSESRNRVRQDSD